MTLCQGVFSKKLFTGTPGAESEVEPSQKERLKRLDVNSSCQNSEEGKYTDANHEINVSIIIFHTIIYHKSVGLSRAFF